MDLTDKIQLIKYLKEQGLWAKHGLGQNFLVDRGALDKIIQAADLQGDDFVIEVGPGLGTLTEELVKKARKVIAVELDEKLAELLFERISKSEFLMPNKMSKYQNLGNLKAGSFIRNWKLELSNLGSELEIMNADILKVNLKEIIDDRPYKVVANIPYYITSKIIRLFLEQANKPERMVMLVQKEVAERICAKPGDMSVLAISVQAYSEPEIAGIVPAESFFPAPNVDSAILRIEVFKDQFSIFNQYSSYNFQTREQFEKEFFRLVNIGFASRRKTLANNLSAGYHIDKKTAADIIKEVGLSENIRAQELGVEDWKNILAVMDNEHPNNEQLNKSMNGQRTS